jgi:hypothetical protein
MVIKVNYKSSDCAVKTEGRMTYIKAIIVIIENETSL